MRRIRTSRTQKGNPDLRVSYVKGAQIMDRLKKIQNEEWWDNKSRKYLNKSLRRAVSDYE